MSNPPAVDELDELTVTVTEPSLNRPAAALAERLGLRRVAEERPGDAFWRLRLTPQRLELCPPDAAPLAVDFAAGRNRHRRLHGGGKRQLIARAVGLRRPTATPLYVVDATAGFGHDAFVLAALGCRVLMLERNPVVAALLADGLRRAAAEADLAAWLPQRLRLESADAISWLPQPRPAAARPDVVYLDPMYPPRRKTAQVKKTARALQRLAGSDDDSARLLAAALNAAGRRVVVKRPAAAARLDGPPADFSRRDGATRYDIYTVCNP